MHSTAPFEKDSAAAALGKRLGAVPDEATSTGTDIHFAARLVIIEAAT